MRHTITVLVENRHGVLARVAGLFSRRGFNIDSLSVNITHDPTISRMTIVVAGEDEILEQITKQLDKLVDVIKVIDYTGTPSVERELALIRVRAENGARSEIMQIVAIFRARIIDISERSFTIEVTGSSEKVDALEKLLDPFGIVEMVRGGKVVMARGICLETDDED
ncbi:MAG TPA: acetolactate synthase small subunit [Armatimonadota bacterium]|jgi:acetolactate synthase-1/3 small subunit